MISERVPLDKVSFSTGFLARILKSVTKIFEPSSSQRAAFPNLGTLSLIQPFSYLPPAQALEVNKSLLHVNLGHNSIQGKGAFVLADCLSRNTSLLRLDLDGNPVGMQGGRALLRAVCSGIKLVLHMQSCNFDLS